MDNLNLYKKMFAVMDESEAIEKSMTVGSGANSYKAVSEASMLNLIKPLFKKHKLIVFPIDGEINENINTYEKTDSYKNTVSTTLRAVTQLKVMYKIVDTESGESETLVGFGNGADSQDKGAGKSSTYSFKNMLSKTFMLFSGEDTDNTHSDDINPPSKSPQAPKPQGDAETTITTQILLDMAKSKGFDEAAVCKRFKVTEAKFIKKEDKKIAYENFKKLPDKI